MLIICLGIYLACIIGKFEPFVNGFEEISRIASTTSVCTPAKIRKLAYLFTCRTASKSDVAYCADCKEKLYYCTTQNFEERQDHFVCSTSRKKCKGVCAPDKSSGHRIQNVRINLVCIGFLPESIITEMVNPVAKNRTA